MYRIGEFQYIFKYWVLIEPTYKYTIQSKKDDNTLKALNTYPISKNEWKYQNLSFKFNFFTFKIHSFDIELYNSFLTLINRDFGLFSSIKDEKICLKIINSMRKWFQITFTYNN